MVVVPKSVKLAVLKHLFKHNGLCMEVTVRKQDVPQITFKDENGAEISPRNLYVNMIMKSMCSKGYAKRTFAWNHYYYVLTIDGEKYIRKTLDIDATVRPDPCNKQIAEKPQEERRAPRDGFNRGGPRTEHKPQHAAAPRPQQQE